MYIPTLIVYTYMHHGQYARPSPTWEREREKERAMQLLVRLVITENLSNLTLQGYHKSR